MEQQIAVIGMGQMGSALAERLSEVGFDVLGYDINAQTRQHLADRAFVSRTACEQPWRVGK